MLPSTGQSIEISVRANDTQALSTIKRVEAAANNLFEGFKAKSLVIKTDPKTNETVRFTAQLTDGIGKLITATGDYTLAAGEANVTQYKLSEDFLKEEKAAQRDTKATKDNAKAKRDLASANKDAGNNANLAEKKFTTLTYVMHRLAYTLLSTVTRAFREAFKEMKNVDAQLTTISRITQTSIGDLDRLKDKAYEVGSAYGVLASDYLSAAAAFTRAGYREQAEDLAELSSKLQIAGQVSAETANQLLIATDKAYNLNGSMKDLSAVMDKMTVIDHRYATSVDKIAQGMGIVAPVAAQAHMSIDELIASLGTITAVTQRSGSEAARAMRALILSIIKDTTTEIDEGVTWTVEEINSLQDALKVYAPEVVKAAEATGSLIDPMEAIGALAKSYEDGLLTEAKLAELTSKLGGKLRSSQLLTLIQNYSGMYTQMMSDMGNAIGAVDKDVDKALQSWEVKLNQLKNTFTKFIADTLSSDAIKWILDAINWIVSGIGNIGNALAILGTTFVALNITRIIGWFSKLHYSIKAIGGGVKSLIITLANYRTASKAGAVGTEAFNNALEKTTLAASLAKIAIASAAVAFSLIVIAINNAKQAEEQRRQKSIEAAKSAASEADELLELKKKYDELKVGFEEGKTSREEYEAAQDAIIQKLKDEGVWTETAKGGYDDLTEAIEKSTDAALKAKKVDLVAGLRDAIEEIDEPLHSTFLGDASVPSWEVITMYNRLYGTRYGHDATTNDLFGRDENQQLANILAFYDKLIEYRKDLDKSSDAFMTASKVITMLEEPISKVLELYKEFFDLATEDDLAEFKGNPIFEYLYEKFKGLNNELTDSKDTVRETAEDTGRAVEGLSTKLEKATKSLEKYKEALKGGEKGDTYKSIAEAYKKAVDLLDKGLTGTNEYMAAVDMIIPQSMLREWGYNYEKAGEYLKSELFSASLGDATDFAVGFANYIRDNKDVYKDFVDVIDGIGDDEGTFSLLVKDVKGLSAVTGFSEETIWSFVDALDAFRSNVTYTREELLELLHVADADNWDGQVNLTEFINDLAQSGKTEREIYQIVEALREMAKADPTIKIKEPENLNETVDKVLEIKEETEDNKEIEFVFTSNVDEFFDDVMGVIKQLDGTEIYIGVKYKNENNPTRIGSLFDKILDTAHDFAYRLQSNASGTDSARGGLSLVNDGDGAEIISANGRAWIAGGGEPTITNLPVGARVFNAKETREILTRSGINAFSDTVGAVGVGGIPTGDSSSRKSSSKSVSEMLDGIGKQVEKILKKAKEALDQQLKAIDKQIDELKKAHDVAEDKNKLEELQLKIIEAEKKLTEAKNERTVRYFNKETGQWELMADQKAVYEAEKALKEAQDAYAKESAEQNYQKQIDALEDLKEKLKEEYQGLEDHWEEIVKAAQESEEKDVDVEKLIKQLGVGGDAAGKIKELIAAIQEYEKNLANGTYGMPLDGETTAKLLSANGLRGSTPNTLAQIMGLTRSDTNAKGTSLYSTNSTSSIIGNTYYINGIKIGNDMMDKPLSQILSVLPIYAN